MEFEIPENISSIKYWKFLPGQGYKTKPKITRKRSVISGIETALQEGIKYEEYYEEDPREPRHLMLLYSGNGKSRGIKVFRGFTFVNNDCYKTKTNNLMTILESLPQGELQTLSGRPVIYENEFRS